METHTVLSQLSHSKHLKSVCVKLLIKGSTVVGTTRKTYQLILGDEQVTTFTKDLDDSFEIPMEEGDWYELQNFEVAYAFGVTRVTRYRHQINLSDSSIIFKIPPLSFCHYYRFQTFENIQRGLAHPKFSIDIFGAMVAVGDIEEAEIENHSLYFSLVNMEYEHINCVAYGEVALFLDNYWNSTNAPIVLCVLQFWEIDWGVGGFKHVKTIDGFSRILFEPDDVPEIQSFRMR
ncbi:unnamed protein product [Brassica oleracea var. botrytis]